MSYRAAITIALDAIQDGDPEYAAATLRNALMRPDPRRPHRCRWCPMTFRWPGQLEDHHRNVHEPTHTTTGQPVTETPKIATTAAA